MVFIITFTPKKNVTKGREDDDGDEDEQTRHNWYYDEDDDEDHEYGTAQPLLLLLLLLLRQLEEVQSESDRRARGAERERARPGERDKKPSKKRGGSIMIVDLDALDGKMNMKKKRRSSPNVSKHVRAELREAENEKEIGYILVFAPLVLVLQEPLRHPHLIFYFWKQFYCLLRWGVYS